MSKEAKIKAISAMVLVGTTAAIFFHYACASYLRRPYPHTTFLVDPLSAFTDFFDHYRDTANNNPYGPGPTGVYPPFCYLLTWPLTLLRPRPALILFLGVSAGFVLLFNWHALRVRDTWARLFGAFILTFLAYPVLMVLDRGNVDGFLFILMALFLLAYRNGHSTAAVVLLALAGAMKAFPALFLLLYVADRRYREALAVCGLVALLTAAGMYRLEGGPVHTLFQYPAKLAELNAGTASSDSRLWFNSTLYGGVRALFRVKSQASCHRLYTVYQGGCLVLLAALSWYLVWRERSFWRRVSLLTLAMLLLPAFNYDYRLIFLYLPLALFLDERPGPLDPCYVLLFGLLLVPKAYLILRGWISISVIINPFLLMGLVGLNLYERRALARQHGFPGLLEVAPAEARFLPRKAG
jgi:hypothetical protein